MRLLATLYGQHLPQRAHSGRNAPFPQIKIDKWLHTQLLIEKTTNKIHPQQMTLAAIAVTLTHYLKRLDSRIDVFNNNPITRQLTIEPLLLLRQRMVFALLEWRQ